MARCGTHRQAWLRLGCWRCRLPEPMILFWKLNEIFFGYFYSEMIVFINTGINYFQGDLGDVSAKTTLQLGLHAVLPARSERVWTLSACVISTCRNWPFNLISKTTSLPVSLLFQLEHRLSDPGKLFIFIINKYYFRSKVPQKNNLVKPIIQYWEHVWRSDAVFLF